MKIRRSRIVMVTSILLASVTLLLAAWSRFDRIGLIEIPFDTHLQANAGHLIVRHLTTAERSIPATEWPGDPIPANRISPPSTPSSLFGYSSGHQLGNLERSGRITPTNYWRLWFPLWSLALIFAIPAGLRFAQSMQKAKSTAHLQRPVGVPRA